MSPEMMEELVIFLFYMVGLNAVLLVGCLVADYIFPHRIGSYVRGLLQGSWEAYPLLPPGRTTQDHQDRLGLP